MKTHRYQARWHDPRTLRGLGNVDFRSASNNRAILMADRIGREIGLPNTPRTIHREGVLIHTKP